MKTTVIVEQIVTLFIILTIGVIIKRKKIIDNKTISGVSNYLVYVALPSLIIASMHHGFEKKILQDTYTLILLSILSHFLIILLTLLLTKPIRLSPKKKGVLRFITIFGNASNLGYPVCNIVFGPIGVFYASIYNLFFMILMWTFGVGLLKGSNERINWKTLINPGLISVMIGYIFFLTPYKLPSPLLKSFNLLGDTIAPLAMIVIGGIIADEGIIVIFKNYRLYMLVLFKQLVFPITLMIILKKLGFDSMLIGVAVIIMAMPSAVNGVILSKKYGADAQLASQGVVLTTLLSIITLPIIITMVMN